MNELDAGWSIVSASVRGASHIRNGRPNQDATTHRSFDGAVPGAVAAVADGHGGTRYVRSDRGSAFAVGIACDASAEFIAQHADLRGVALADAARETLIPTVVERWREVVLADLAKEAFTDEEQERSGQLLGEDIYLAYGATLLIAAAWDDTTLLLQLGDGDLVAVLPSGEVQRPIPEDARLVAGETTSLGLPDAIESFRIAELPINGRNVVELLMLCTDGYGNSFADPDWRHDVGADLLARARQDDLEVLGRALPAWLAESASAGGDDVTMALLHRDASAAVPAPSAIPATAIPTAEHRAVVPPPVVDTTPSTPPRSGRGGRTLLAILGVLVLLALRGAAIGWALRGDDTAAQSAGSDPTTLPTEPGGSPTTTLGREVSIPTGRGVVRFRSASADDATFTPETGNAATPNKLVAGNFIWTLDRGTLKVTDLAGANSQTPLDPTILSKFTPVAMVTADGKVWLASNDGLQLAYCDTNFARCTGPIQVGQSTSGG